MNQSHILSAVAVHQVKGYFKSYKNMFIVNIYIEAYFPLKVTWILEIFSANLVFGYYFLHFLSLCVGMHNRLAIAGWYDVICLPGKPTMFRRGSWYMDQSFWFIYCQGFVYMSRGVDISSHRTWYWHTEYISLICHMVSTVFTCINCTLQVNNTCIYTW